MFVFWMYLKGKNPAAEWSSQSAFNGNKATKFHIFSAPLSHTEAIIISYYQLYIWTGLYMHSTEPT